jgi:DNA-directed RNA polymerase specialized sigma24 family protein
VIATRDDTVGYRSTMPVYVDLSWFYSLNLHDRVNLLNNPRQSLISQFVDRIVAQVKAHGIDQAVVDETQWNGSSSWKLDESMRAKLEEDGQKLDRWFESLTPAERNHVILHRSEEGTQTAATKTGVDPRMAHPYLDMRATKLGLP